jgi:hypothetical protein
MVDFSDRSQDITENHLALSIANRNVLTTPFLVVASHVMSQLKHEGSAIVPAVKTTIKLLISNSDADNPQTPQR